MVSRSRKAETLAEIGIEQSPPRATCAIRCSKEYGKTFEVVARGAIMMLGTLLVSAYFGRLTQVRAASRGRRAACIQMRGCGSGAFDVRYEQRREIETSRMSGLGVD
jgi:hypothetical protein